jgi:hypothetical protein
MAGVVAGAMACVTASGCAESGSGADEAGAEQSGALTAAAISDWPQFQRDAVHGGDNLAEGAFTSAKVRRPLQTAFKAHYGSTGDEAGAVESGGILKVP